MDQYEDKSSQLLILINQLSETRSKKVLQGLVQDLLTNEKSKLKDLILKLEKHQQEQEEKGEQELEEEEQKEDGEEDDEDVDETQLIDQENENGVNESNITILKKNKKKQKQQQLQLKSSNYIIDLCQTHINNTELSSQPSVLWKIVEYIISELNYLERILDTQQEKKENTKLLSSTSIRLEEISNLISYLQSTPKMHTGEYSELFLGINGQSKKITLKLKNCLEDNQYSNAKKYGWIEKRCGKNQSFSSWKRMWFILKDDKLTYFIKEKNLKKRSSTIGSTSDLYRNQQQNGILDQNNCNNSNNNCSNNNNNNNNNNNSNNNSSSQIIVDSILHVNLEGEVGKKKEGKGWKVRWMKLLDHSLVYFKSSKDKEPLGTINLNECQDCEIINAPDSSSNKFVVVHPSNRYYFKTNSKEELTQWVKSVKDRIPSMNQTKMDLDQFQLKGVIEFSTITLVSECYKFNNQPNCILITTTTNNDSNEKTYYLSFDSNKEKTEWLSLLNSSVSKVKSGASSSSSSSNPSSPSPPQVRESKDSGNGGNSPNIISSLKSSYSKPWRFSSSPSSTSASPVSSNRDSLPPPASISKQVKFTENPLLTNNNKGNGKDGDQFEYGSQILPRKSTLIGPNGGVQVSSTGAVELSPVLLSSNGNGSGSGNQINISSNTNNNNNNNTKNNNNCNSLNDLINEASDNEDGEDSLKMMIPESLKNEMMRRSAISLLKTFKCEIFIGSNPTEVFTFLFSDSVLVDQVKAFAFKKIPSLSSFSLFDYRLGIDEETFLEVEFLKFIYSHTMVELALKTCGIVKIGVFHHRKGRFNKDRYGSDKYYGQMLSQSPDGRKPNPYMTPNSELSKSEPNLQYCISSSPSDSPSSSPPQSQPPLPTAVSTTNLISITPTPQPSPPQQQQQTPTPIITTTTTTTTTTIVAAPPTTSSSSGGSFIAKSPLSSSHSAINIGNSLSRSNSILSSSPSPSGSPLFGSTSPVAPKNSAWQSVNPSISLNQRRQLISQCPGWNIEPTTTPSFSSVGFKPKFDKQEHGFYRRYNLDGTSTVQSFLGVDPKMGPVAFSLAKDSNDNYRGVLHTKHGAKAISEDAKNINGLLNILSLGKKAKTKRIVSHLIGLLDSTIDSKLLNLASNQSDLQKELLSFEERQTTSGFKFGMVYCRHGQVTDDEIFSNKQGSGEWDEFLALIGDKIELVGWPHYSAGLDVKFNSTGTHSLYTDYHGNEVMFHVSTMLPFSNTDFQQIERKRQVGNDICVVIFNDGTLSYMPNTITSQFNHVVILVQYDKQNNGYKVSMACKDGVKTPFEPLSPNNLIKKSDIKDFLITKLINGELASLQAPVFSSKITRTRESLLNYYISQFL